MANQEFIFFKPTDINGEEIYYGLGGAGFDSMTAGYPLNWTTRLENKGRLYRKSVFTFETAGYMRSNAITKTATIKQKGLPVFTLPTVGPILNRSMQGFSVPIAPKKIDYVLSLSGDNAILNTDYLLDILNDTNAQWLEISIEYDAEEEYENGGTLLKQATLGDSGDIYDGGNRSAFLNRIRESLYYEFGLEGVEKMRGYQESDNEERLRFKMYYIFSQNDLPDANFTDYIGIGTTLDFENYKRSEISNGNTAIEDMTYTQIGIEELSDATLNIYGGELNTSYLDYYMKTKTTGEAGAYDCRVEFNANPTYNNGNTDVHYFESFASSTNNDYYLGDDAFIFHIIIKPRGFAKKWIAEETYYNTYLQWNYVPYDIRIIIMVKEPIPYLEFNNSDLLRDDNVLLKADENDTKQLYVNSNMLWNINYLEPIVTYDVIESEIEGGDPLYTENSR